MGSTSFAPIVTSSRIERHEKAANRCAEGVSYTELLSAEGATLTDLVATVET